MTVPASFPKNVPASSAYTGSLAPHDMKGAISTVTRRFLGSSMVLVAMMAGTLHPKPIISGMKDFPCNPSLLMNLSMMNAALAI